MESTKVAVARKCEDLMKLGGMDKEIFIYGAKTVAQRCCRYLEYHGIHVAGFLVSNRYKNPETVEGHHVWKLEEHTDHAFDIVINAVSFQYLSQVTKFLKQYDIKQIVEISSVMDDAFPWKEISVNERCRISPHAYVAEGAEIFADETSEIVIEDGAHISSRSVILASEQSKIHIGQDVMIREDAGIIVCGDSVLTIGCRNCLGRFMRMNCQCKSVIKFGTHVQISDNSILSVGNYGALKVGSDTTINDFSNFGTNGGKIHIGKDNMLSYHVKMDTGSHQIFDMDTGECIAHNKPIVTEDHVWIGIGATLLGGCYVGENSIIGASSVVTKEFPSHCTIAGNPAKILRQKISWER